MNIEINNQTKDKISKKLIINTAENFFRYFKIKNKEISIAFVTDSKIKKLNKKYRKKDQITDVLAFPGENDYLGEVIIDYSQIKRQAKIFSKNVKDELLFILTHGLLHLLGYKDDCQKDKEIMEKLGHKFIQKNKI